MSDFSRKFKETHTPTRSRLVFGEGIFLEQNSHILDGAILVTQGGPKDQLPAALVERAAQVILAESLEASDLERMTIETSPNRPVVGIGGGVVMDTAKWLGWSHDSPLFLVPSSTSVDASVTNAVAVRDNGVVKYRGFAEPVAIYVDASLIRTAPLSVNRAGIGDLLSIHTAVWDWQLGAQAGVATFEESIAARATNILETTIHAAEKIAEISNDGIETLMLGYSDINDLTLAMGHAQMEEGSEHYFAYLVEQQTGRSFVHGELVTLGTVLMSRLQENSSEMVEQAADRAKVRWRPQELLLSREVLVEVLKGLPEFVQHQKYPHSVLNSTVMTDLVIECLLEGLEV